MRTLYLFSVLHWFLLHLLHIANSIGASASSRFTSIKSEINEILKWRIAQDAIINTAKCLLFSVQFATTHHSPRMRLFAGSQTPRGKPTKLKMVSRANHWTKFGCDKDSSSQYSNAYQKMMWPKRRNIKTNITLKAKIINLQDSIRCIIIQAPVQKESS